MPLIDTSILIDLTRNPPSEAAMKWLSSLSTLPLIPEVARLELLQGASNKKELDGLNSFFSRLQRVFHSREDQIRAEEILTAFHCSHGIEISDCLIAATAIRLNETLFTLNGKQLEPIEGLKLEVPYQSNKD